MNHPLRWSSWRTRSNTIGIVGRVSVVRERRKIEIEDVLEERLGLVVPGQWQGVIVCRAENSEKSAGQRILSTMTMFAIPISNQESPVISFGFRTLRCEQPAPDKALTEPLAPLSNQIPQDSRHFGRARP